jgi:phosphatidylglycerol:prolipoprotein diacylglycerol transferase
MQRILFTIPGLGLRLHGFSLMMVLACFGALGLTVWRARRERLDPEAVFGLATWLYTGGFIGARILYLVQHPEAMQHVGDVVKIWQGGIVFYGCILGGLAGSLLYWVRQPFPFRAMADAVAPALALGYGLGRIGCFLNGCCFGETTGCPLAVAFPAGSPVWLHHLQRGLISPSAPCSLAVHPTQLYGAFDGLVLLGLLTWFFPRRRRDGEVMALLMVTYPVLRFGNECLRDDEEAVLAGLTSAQAISIVLLLCGLLTWCYLARQPRGRHADRSETSGADLGPRRGDGPESPRYAGRRQLPWRDGKQRTWRSRRRGTYLKGR